MSWVAETVVPFLIGGACGGWLSRRKAVATAVSQAVAKATASAQASGGAVYIGVGPNGHQYDLGAVHHYNSSGEYDQYLSARRTPVGLPRFDVVPDAALNGGSVRGVGSPVGQRPVDSMKAVEAISCWGPPVVHEADTLDEFYCEVCGSHYDEDDPCPLH